MNSAHITMVIIACGFCAAAAASAQPDKPAEPPAPAATTTPKAGAPDTPDAPEATEAAEPDAIAPIDDYPAFFPLDYSGDFLDSRALTGDWGGARTGLANDGISFRVETLQTLQGSVHGGKDTGFEYFGSADYLLEFDTYRMDLWPGGYFRVRGETPWGRNANQRIGAVSNPNFDALFPVANDPGLTTLTEVWYLQALSEELYVLGGKLDPSRLPGQNEFASDYYAHFMNTSLWQNPVTFSTIPYTAFAAGVGYKPTEWFDGATLFLDSFGSPTRSGFDTAFHSPNGLTIVQSLAFHYHLSGLKGNQRVAASWSSRDKVALEDLDRLFLAGATAPSFSRLNVPRALQPGGQLPRPARFLRRAAFARLLDPQPSSDDWMISYDFDQELYRDAEDPSRRLGVFGRFGWSPGELNPISTFYSIGLGGTGLIPTREKDRFGVGYYLMNFSNDIPGIIGLNAEQGVELFYNIEVTPWLHITPDIQVIIDPGRSDARDTAVVFGLRTQISF